MPALVRDEQTFPVPGSEVPRGVITVTKRVVEEDDGSIREQFIWKRGGFVVVVPVDKDGSFLLKKEFKYAAMRDLLTFPSGGIKGSESPEEAAVRELKEELGVAGRMILLSPEPLFNSPDKSTEYHFIFLALDVEEVDDGQREPGEIVRVEKRVARNFLRPAELGCLRTALQRLAFYEALSFLSL